MYSSLMSNKTPGNPNKYSIASAFIGYSLGFVFSWTTGIALYMGTFNVVPAIFMSVATAIGTVVAMREGK